MNAFQEPKKKKPARSALLDRVLFGSSSVCLHLVKHADFARPPMFKSRSLNRTIIFKYPNFAVAPTAVGLEGSDPQRDAPETVRPIETAIFVPYDSGQLDLGGHGIYLRQKSYKELMLRHVGIDLDDRSEVVAQDLKVLDEIDRIPSLDPFLLKSAIRRIYPSVDECYFAIGEHEAASTRAIIAAKVQPIIERALEGVPAAERRNHINRFLAALWDPTLPEAELFISAFGIHREGASGIFEALKGVSFYQWNINANRDAVVNTVKWLQSADGLPYDMRQHMHFKENIDMFRTQIVRNIRQISKVVSGIFLEFESAHAYFLRDGDPKPFRQFLEEVHKRYWVLGYSSTALTQVSHLYENAMKNSYKSRLSFEQTTELLTLMNMALASQSVPPTSG